MGLPVGLIRFKDYLLQKIVPGSSVPPASIKAADLDKNFAMLCLQPDSDVGYDVSITENGTKIDPTQSLRIVHSIEFTSDGTYITSITPHYINIYFMGYVNG